jgi:hypothetical protein
MEVLQTKGCLGSIDPANLDQEFSQLMVGFIGNFPHQQRQAPVLEGQAFVSATLGKPSCPAASTPINASFSNKTKVVLIFAGQRAIWIRRQIEASCRHRDG